VSNVEGRLSLQRKKTSDCSEEAGGVARGIGGGTHRLSVPRLHPHDEPINL